MWGLGARRSPAAPSPRVEITPVRVTEAFEVPFWAAGQHRTAGSTLEGLIQNYVDTYGMLPTASPYQGFMSIPGAWRASVLLSDLFGETPWHTYRLGPDGNEVRTPRNAPILESPAGSREDPVVVRASWMLDYIWQGNMIGVYATRAPNGLPTSILPWPASLTGIRDVIDGDGTGGIPGRRQYLIGTRVLDERDVFHVKGPCAPADLRGMGVIEVGLTALRLARELGTQAGSIAGAGVPTGTLSSSNPEAPKADLVAAKAAWIAAQRTRTVAALGPNIEFTPVAWNPEEMQLVEARKFSLTELELLFGLPVGWLGGATSSRTYSNIEQDAVNLIKFSTLAGAYARCQSKFTSLIPRGQSAKPNRDAQLKSDTLTRYQAHTIALGNRAWATPNEIRGIENMAPVDGGDTLAAQASDVGATDTTDTTGGES